MPLVVSGDGSASAKASVQRTAAQDRALRPTDQALPRADGPGEETLLGDGHQRFTVVVFVSSQCPCSHAYVGRLRDLARRFADSGDVRFVGVFANQDESQSDIARYAEEARFGFRTLRDPGAVVADRLNAQVTPQAFVFDRTGKLQYQGRIDDSQDPVGVTRRELLVALEALLAGKKAPRGGRAFGCGIVRTAERTDSDPGWETRHVMRGLTGPWSMSREGSGTAWLPDSSPVFAIQGESGPWQTMWHGYQFLAGSLEKRSPRLPRRSEGFGAGWLMAMGNRALGLGETFGLRVMVSTDPLLQRRDGYPLLFQTGETAYGRPLVDRQHPHDFVMEAAATVSKVLGDPDRQNSLFLYLAPVGEPALGPTAFPHRPSAWDNPEAPLGHHWLDSTHIASGVATAGIASGTTKVEGSIFTGRASDERRFVADRMRFDSFSGRVTFNPTADLSVSASHGFLKAPEATELYTNQYRTIVSLAYNRSGTDGSQWQTTLAYGRLRKRIPVLLGTGGAVDRGGKGRHLVLPGLPYAFEPFESDALLVESAFHHPRYTLFGRFEAVEKDELFPEAIVVRAYPVRKVTVGAVRNLALRGSDGGSDLGIGASVSLYEVPSALRSAYGDISPSVKIFLRWRTAGFALGNR